MQIYQTDKNGFFVAIDEADPDPLTPGAWLIPGGCVETAPPKLSKGQRAKWDGSKWNIIDKTPEPELKPEPTKQEQQDARQSAFQREADPLFFKVQRGEATEQEWLDKVAEIRARYPYPEE
jgi:hypothetical protein